MVTVLPTIILETPHAKRRIPDFLSFTQVALFFGRFAPHVGMIVNRYNTNGSIYSGIENSKQNQYKRTDGTSVRSSKDLTG